MKNWSKSLDETMNKIVDDLYEDLRKEDPEITREQVVEVYVMFWRGAADMMRRMKKPLINVPSFGRFVQNTKVIRDKLEILKNTQKKRKILGWKKDLSDVCEEYQKTLDRIIEEKQKRKRK